MKDAFKINDRTYTRLILGERHIIDTGTAHSMYDMLNNSYRNINSTKLGRIAQQNPEFYKYIVGSFVNEGLPFPANSDLSNNLFSRIAYYFYSQAMKPELDAKWELFYKQATGAVIDQAEANKFANNWLNVNALLAQATVTVANAFDDDPAGLTQDEKLRVASAIIDSGKGEFFTAILSDEKEEILKVIEACIVEVPWFNSVGGAASELLEEVVSAIPQKIIDCVIGEGYKTATRFVNTAKGLLSLRDYNSYKLATTFMDLEFSCGFNPTCMAAKLGGKTDYSEQLYYILDRDNLDSGALDWTIKNYAVSIIDDYYSQVVGQTNLIFSYLSPELIREYQRSNKDTSTLDARIEAINVRDEQQTLTLDITINNTSGREIKLTDALFLMTKNGEEIDISAGLVNNPLSDLTLAAQDNIVLENVAITLPADTVIDGTFRLATWISYESTDNVFEDTIQRVTDIEPGAPEVVSTTFDDTKDYSALQMLAVHLFNLPLDELNYDYNTWGENPDLYSGESGHAGIDVQTKDVVNRNPDGVLRPFYSLSDGEVISATEGSRYNLISVYDATRSISTIYLHAKSIDVAVGDRVSIGDRLGVQGDQGVSGAWHVHVEVRKGPRKYAAVNRDGSLDPLEYLFDDLQALAVNYTGDPVTSSDSTRTINPYDVYDSNDQYLYTVDTFYLSGVYDENILIEGGTVYVSGSAKIYGSLTQTGGALKVNGGTLIVNGHYYIDSTDGQSPSGGQLHMVEANDKVRVEGDFIMHTNGYGHFNQEPHSYLTAGELEVKGDFTQRYASNHHKSFYAQGTHTVVLSGSQPQVVTFDTASKDQSHFSVLAITNTSSVIFSTRISVTKLFDHQQNLFVLNNTPESTDFVDYDDDSVKDHLDTYPTDPLRSSDDRDNDGVKDNVDAFPDNPSESVDTDGIGNNADLDDDNDDIPDTWELAYGLDPLDASDASADSDDDGTSNLAEYLAGTNPQGTYSFDIDGDGTVLPLTDGLLAIRYQFGFRGESLVSNATSGTAIRSSAIDIEAYIAEGQIHFDLDGDGNVLPLTDGLLLLRYLFGFRGDGLVANAIGTDATRTTSDQLDSYLGNFLD